MAPGPGSFSCVLQNAIQPADRKWIFSVPNLPHASTTNRSGLIKSISVVSDTAKQRIHLQYVGHSENRAISSQFLERYISISFEKFRLQYSPDQSKDGTKSNPSQPATPKESKDYIFRLLSSGITLNRVQYNFFAHSNSQLKSKSCFLCAGTKEDIARQIDGLGDFSKINSVAKFVKRVGLLFSSAKIATQLEPERCQDLADVTRDEYIFTDGCGLISKHFARELVQKLDLRFRNLRYHPSVFQIRYRGYKGVLTLEPKLHGQILVQFRDSMRKVKDVTDCSFAVVEYSKPYGFGYLNDEVVLLLRALGIPVATFLGKQQEYLHILSVAHTDPQAAFRLLSYNNEPEKAEKMLIEGLESVKGTIQSQISSEHSRMLNKRAEQRCRILIPQSRLLFGVCDPRNVLKQGQCAIRITMDHGGVPTTIAGCDVLVTRNPCLHPGDLQKFKAVQCDELAHLTDCIIFSTQGRRPSADLMSGGDLDGDKFFVCWDPDLIPSTVAQAANYTGPPEPVNFKKITHEDRLAFFAGYTNASLGRVKNLFLDWARLKGPMSPECQELNHLFSRCVDGNRIKVPPRLENIPKAESPNDDFILDVLHRAAEAYVANASPATDLQGLPADGIELFLSREDVMFTEFELFKMAVAWCSRNDTSIAEYLDAFDFGQMSDEEKNWVLGQLPAEERTPKFVMNGLLQSNLLSKPELQSCKLDHSSMRWKCIFDSSIDRLGRFMEAMGKALEMFCRKIVVLRVSSRLTVAIYIPKKAKKYQETVVDNNVRLLSFPHSQEAKATYRQIMPTKMDYRLYYDSTGLQLYERQRANTWVFLTQPGQDDAPYRDIEGAGDTRRSKQSAIESGMNSDLVTSIALNKFSNNLAKHIGRVNRSPIIGAEVYVISNRDTRSLQILDQWLHYVDTQEILPLFDRSEREYLEPNTKDVDWSAEPQYIQLIARDRLFTHFGSFESVKKYTSVFDWLWEHGQKSALRQAFTHLLASCCPGARPVSGVAIMGSMIDFLKKAPSLAITFTNIEDWKQLPTDFQLTLSDRSDDILKALATSAHEMDILVVEPFKHILTQISCMSLCSFSSLVEHISLVVRSSEIALDLFMECLDQESPRIFSARPTVVHYFTRNCIGVAMEHIEEASESASKRMDTLELKRDTIPQQVAAHVRIDSHSFSRFSGNDHVQLTATTLPSNSLETKPYSMDALVLKSSSGSVTFRCLQPLPTFVEDCTWKVKSCGSFVTSKAMFDAMNDLITTPEESCLIHDRILGTSENDAGNDTTAALIFNRRSDLNYSQNDAIIAALNSDLTCIWGPPGTGKTHTIAILLEVLAADPNIRLLVTAPSHNAVDNVMRKYLHTINLANGPKTNPLRVSTDVRKVAEDLRKHTCDAMYGKDLNEDHASRRKAQKQIKECRLVFTTCIGAGLGLLRSEMFDTVIIDEASQQVEPLSLVPLVKGCQKAILVGDHVQLRATVHPHSQVLGFDVSLFERLYNSSGGDSRLRKVMLDTQYRMHESICGFNSVEFYDGHLKTAVEDSTRPLLPSNFPWPSTTPPGKATRMFFVQCSAPEDLGQKSKSNAGQAAVTRSICKKLLQQVDQTASAIPSVAALVPYSRQAELLKDLTATGVAVNSIDGFQGREADVVVFGTTRCNVHAEVGFLKDLRRLNVVLTRAKSALIIVGDRITLTGGDPAEEATGVWKRLLETLTPLVLVT